ncbi:hypothetical protein RFI_00363, partial [Reticulomyxa filosa]
MRSASSMRNYLQGNETNGKSEAKETNRQPLEKETKELMEWTEEDKAKLNKANYQIKRRLSSQELWKSHYKNDKMHRLRYRRRSKSDPEKLAMTQRWHRKCDYEYRPNTKNLFMLSAVGTHSNDPNKINEHEPKLGLIPSSRQDEQFLFRYLFDDEDYTDSEPSLSLSVIAGDVVDLLDLNAIDEKESYVGKDKTTTESTMVSENVALHKDKQKTKKQTDKRDSDMPNESRRMSYRESMMSRIIPNYRNKTTVSQANKLFDHDTQHQGHTYAKKEWIEQEFGKYTSTLLEFNVKKKDKWGRDQPRVLVVDITMQ